MSKYELRTNKKKDDIIKSALALFKANGYVCTSIKEIAEKAEVSQVSIYNYFGSKDALVLECAKVLVKGTVENVMKVLDEDISYKEKVIKALSFCNGEIEHTLKANLSEEALKDKNFLALLSDGIGDLQRELYKAFVEEGKKEGAIRQELPTETILKFLDSFNQIEISNESNQQELGHLHTLILYGLLGK